MIKQNFNIESSKKNYKISCTLYLPDNSNIKKVIIACHGFGGDKESSAIYLLAKKLTTRDIAVIAFDFPSHGISNTDGYDFSLKNCISDINDVENFVLKNIRETDIGFFATSFGAYAVLLKMNESHKEYRSVVLRCPALDMKKIFESNILNIKLNEFIKEGKCIVGFERKVIVTREFYEELVNNDIYRLYKKKNKICIIHGTEDNIAPINDSIAFKNKFNNDIKLFEIRGADHRFKKEGEIEKVIEIASNYIENT